MVSVLLSIIMLFMFILAILLSALILFQDNKGGLTGALGSPGAESALGAKATEKVSRLTGYFVAAFLLLCLVAAVIKAQQRVTITRDAAAPAPIEKLDPGKAGAEDTADVEQ